MTDRIVRIGGASGFWGDSRVAAPQLVASGQVDYLVFDYLAETTMAILAAARLKRPELGYATDFVDVAMRSVLGEIAAKRIRVVSNAGGIHPRACAAALEAMIADAGLALRVAVVEGDDVSAQVPALAAGGTRDLATGAPLPAQVVSANAYLGALPIAAALAAGADIVVTGRVVDSALALGPLMHEFGWGADAYDLLAAGSLAGHLIECGCQATGGLFTDWESVPDWPDIGYPIAECSADGVVRITKPAGTGGLIARACVAEQLLYEIGDPGAYVLPDVVCDFRDVVVEQDGAGHVRVLGARGRPPTDTLKVSATALHGFRCAASLVIVGIDAVRKAERTGAAILARTSRLLRENGFPDFAATHVEVLGAEASYGPHARAHANREVMLRVVADHVDRRALEIFAREIAPAGTSWSPGTTGAGGGRPPVVPLLKPFSFLLAKTAVDVTVTIGERLVAVAAPMSQAAASLLPTTSHAGGSLPSTTMRPPAPVDEPRREPALSSSGDEPCAPVPLVRLAWARSGDKGDVSNIGVIARRPEWLPLLWDRMTPARVQAWLAHLVHGEVERFHLPGIAAINFVLHDALDGGGMSSRRLDPLGKGMAQLLLEMPIEVPRSIAHAACEEG